MKIFLKVNGVWMGSCSDIVFVDVVVDLNWVVVCVCNVVGVLLYVR